MTETLVTIEALGAQGDGIAGLDGERVFVPGALPGETWAARSDGTFDCSSPAVDRVEPVCRHFGVCGGCIAQHMPDAVYAGWKVDIVRTALRQHNIDHEPSPLQLLEGEGRRRCVLSAERLQNGSIALGYHRPRSHDIVPIEMCPVLVPQITERLAVFREIADVLTGGSGRARLTIVAAEQGLDIDVGECRPPDAPDVRAKLADLAKQHGLARLTVGNDTIVMLGQPTVRLGDVSVPLPRATLFLQAVELAEQSLAMQVGDALRSCKRVADLFCGAGSFTFALAKHARVLAVDSDRAAIEALASGRDGSQGLKPIDVLARDLFREPLSRKELEPFDGVVFDPPRAGSDAQAAMLAKSEVRTVVAVSCNPGTLARDLRSLIDGGYELSSIQPVDQFRYSGHVECVAVLRRPPKPKGRRRR